MAREKSKPPGPSRRPEIELSVRLDAEEITFGEVPSTKVEFFGEPHHEFGHENTRQNLHEHVEKGETYRTVRVDYLLASKLIFVERDRR